MSMELDTLWEFLKIEVFTMRSTHNIFNFYNDNKDNMDSGNGVGIRRENLRNYLASFPRYPETILIGEAPGFRGCRFSGVPFTSEMQLCEGGIPFCGEQSSCFNNPKREATATIFWRTMGEYHPRFLAWNCVPFHPHNPQNKESNRTPSTREIHLYSRITKEVISIINPSLVIAVGRKAEKALSLIEFDCVTVRHPSHGGAKQFKTEMIKLLKI